METAPKGLNEDIVRFISAKKNEPEWLLEWRLKAYRQWLEMPEPQWARVDFPPIGILVRRSVVVGVLIFDRREVNACPLGLRHIKPLSIGSQTPLAQRCGLCLLDRA